MAHTQKPPESGLRRARVIRLYGEMAVGLLLDLVGDFFGVLGRTLERDFFGVKHVAANHVGVPFQLARHDRLRFMPQQIGDLLVMGDDLQPGGVGGCSWSLPYWRPLGQESISPAAGVDRSER